VLVAGEAGNEHQKDGHFGKAAPPQTLPARKDYKSVYFNRVKEFTMNLYVGNLSHQATEADVQQAFAAFGQVASATIIKDKFSGESRGFAFVEMPAKDEADAALAGLSGKELLGQTLIVSEARERVENRGGGARRGDGRRAS
jgi:RNA recognition motif-containing protein